ncbi:MSHA biogenesis protein MshJ [Duganella sp. CF458]|uniref:type II secretion system protein M n=1 Tax=Duganella sp. CF458 TaxID=1884368 RepID=UPI0008E10C84|nr:type II secretion system protein M [Duganella sp. CF458]SFG63467.1 MSHA biogenesis protein MshJ [Duganella sp. CF458]
MKAALLKLEQRVDAMPLRQRMALFAGAIVTLAAIAWFGQFGPMLAERQSLRGVIAQQQAQLDAVDKSIESALKAFESDPNAALQRRLATVQEQIRSTSEDLLNRRQGLVQPQRIVPLLQQILAARPGLKVLALKTLPVSGLHDGQFEALGTSTAGPTPAAAAQPVRPAAALMYRHGVELVVQGSYADLLGYMEALEKVSPRMIWGSARLNVIKHPEANLTLTVYTLSLDDTWVQL